MLCVVGWRVPYRARLVMGRRRLAMGARRGAERRGAATGKRKAREVFFPPNTIGTNWGRRGRPNLTLNPFRIPREARYLRACVLRACSCSKGICFCLVGA